MQRGPGILCGDFSEKQCVTKRNEENWKNFERAEGMMRNVVNYYQFLKLRTRERLEEVSDGGEWMIEKGVGGKGGSSDAGE